MTQFFGSASRLPWIAALLLFLAVAFLRFVPHPTNFAPMTALFFLAPLVFPQRALGLAATFVIVAVTDLIIGLYPGLFFVYGGYLAIGVLGVWAGRQGRSLAGPVAVGLGPVVFFLLSNFGVWLQSGLYPVTGEGLRDCFVLALPFFPMTVAAHVFFVVSVFVAVKALRRALGLQHEQHERS
jgi:hypothetical protein